MASNFDMRRSLLIYKIRFAVKIVISTTDIFSKEMHDRIGHTSFETDRGSEFMGRVPELLEKWNMTPVYLKGQHKAAPAERVM